MPVRPMTTPVGLGGCGLFEFNADGKVNSVGAKVLGKWNKTQLNFKVTSDTLLKKVELLINIPDYMIVFKSDVFGKNLNLEGKIENLKNLKIEITENVTGFEKTMLNAKLDKRYSLSHFLIQAV